MLFSALLPGGLAWLENRRKRRKSPNTERPINVNLNVNVTVKFGDGTVVMFQHGTDADNHEHGS